MATVTADPGELTARQREIMTFIYEFTREYGYQPGFRGMMDHFGFRSPNAIMVHVKGLALRGWVRRADGNSRSLVMLRRPDGYPFRGFADKEVE